MLHLCVTGCLGPLSPVSAAWLLWLGAPILMTQKLSLNECRLCFGTICEPICLFSVICLETERKKDKIYIGLKKNDVCQYKVRLHKDLLQKLYFWKFFFAECSYNHIDTLLKFMTCFMQKNNDLLNNSKYFKTIQSLRF